MKNHILLLKLLCFTLLLNACSSTKTHDDIAFHYSNDGPAVSFAVAKVLVSDKSAAAWECEDNQSRAARAFLTQWIEKKIKAVGAEDSDLLYITISNANICKGVTDDTTTSKYDGLYNVHFSIGPDKLQFDIVVENYRIVPDSLSAYEKRTTLGDQALELIKLFENVLIEKKELYFAQYIVQ